MRNRVFEGHMNAEVEQKFNRILSINKFHAANEKESDDSAK